MTKKLSFSSVSTSYSFSCFVLSVICLVHNSKRSECILYGNIQQNIEVLKMNTFVWHFETHIIKQTNKWLFTLEASIQLNFGLSKMPSLLEVMESPSCRRPSLNKHVH